MKANKLFLLAMGLVAVGCNESQIEEQSLINDAQGEAVEVVIDATVAPVSRAISDVDYSNEAETKSAVDLTFEVGDEIGVYFNNETVGLTHENVKFTASEKTETGVKYTTTEPMILLGAGNNVYAYYPYEATETGFEGSVSRSANLGAWDGYHWFTVPAEQVQVDTKDYSGLSQYVKLISKEKQLTKEGNKVKVNMAFQHAFSYFSLNVKNLTGKEISIKEAVVKVFNGEDAVALAGEFGAVLDDEVDGAKVVAGENVGYEVKVVPADDMVLAADDKTLITAALAPIAAYDRIELTLRTVDGFAYKVVKNVSGTKTLEQGTNQQLSFEVSDENLSPEVVNSEVAEYLLRMNKENIVLDVAADITLNIYAHDGADLAENGLSYGWGGPDTKTITINGSLAHTITFNMVDAGTWFNDVDVVNPDAVVNINDVQIQIANATTSNDWHHTDLVFSSKLNMNRVKMWAPVIARRSATFNTVNFCTRIGCNTYGLWLQPTVEKQVVKVSGDSFFLGDDIRGIKIDTKTNYNEGIDTGLEPQDVELTVEKTWFYQGPKKAAVLVSTLDKNVDVIFGEGNVYSGGEDKENQVWIDSYDVDLHKDLYAADSYDYFAHGRKLNVFNGNWKFEGASWSAVADAQGNDTGVADDQTGLEHALAYGLNTIALKDNTYTLPDVPSTDGVRDITLSGSTDAVINNASGSYPAFGENTLTLKGVTLCGAGHATGVYAACLTLDGVKVEDDLTLRSDKAVIKNSKLNINKKNAYVRVYSAEAEITGNQFFTKGSAILIEPTKKTMSDKVIVTNNEFYASDVTTSTTGVGRGQNRAAVEIDNTTCKEGEVLVLTTSGNTIPEGMSGVWRIFNNVADGATIQANGVYYLAAQDKWYLDGKEVIKLEDGSIILKSVTAE